MKFSYPLAIFTALIAITSPDLLFAATEQAAAVLETVINTAYLGQLFWAGSARSLEKQAPDAAKGAVAGNGENDVMETRMAFIPEYVMGVKAGGGVGSGQDVVAFNYACTHQGSTLDGTYKGATKSLGACPLHLSTYDLTRHGILISGQAYQSLPQVLLEVDGDDIYAVGIFGLIFGRNNNLHA